MFGKNKAGTDSPAPDPRDAELNMREKLAQSTDQAQRHHERELNGRAIALHSTEMALNEKYEAFEKFVHGRLDEFRADLDLMAKFQGMYFDTIPAKRALMSIDGPDPREVTNSKTVAAVLDQVADTVTEIIDEYDDSVDERITALVGRFNDLADLINNIKKKR